MFEDVVEFEPADEKDKKLHFFYNREERVAKASPQVQEYYKGGMRPVRGFKVLFTGYNRIIFLSLIFFVAVAWIYTGINKTRQYANVGGIQMELTAFEYEEEIYVTLTMKNPPKKIKRGFSNLIPKNKESAVPEKIEKTVEAEFFFIEVNNQLVDKKFFTEVFEGEEKSLRTKFTDYDIIRVDVIIDVGEEEKELSCEVKR